MNEFKEITDGELIEKALDIAFIIEKMSYRDVDNMDIGWININITETEISDFYSSKLCIRKLF